MAIRPLIPAMLLSIALVACTEGEPDQLPQVPESMTAEPATAAAAPASASGNVTSEPAGFCADARRQQALIAWDVRDQGAKRVTVHIGESPDARVFFRGGPSGEKETGAWAKPGMVFVVRDGDSGNELGRVVLQSLDC